jgi:hypothetical protein
MMKSGVDELKVRKAMGELRYQNTSPYRTDYGRCQHQEACRCSGLRCIYCGKYVCELHGYHGGSYNGAQVYGYECFRAELRRIDSIGKLG